MPRRRDLSICQGPLSGLKKKFNLIFGGSSLAVILLNPDGGLASGRLSVFTTHQKGRVDGFLT